MNSVFPMLETQRLNLIEINETHIHDIFNIFSDAKVTKFYNIETFTLNDAKPYLNWFISRFKEGLGIRWEYRKREEKKLLEL